MSGPRVVVVGGGISGLAAAWYAAAAGYDVTVLEASAQVGGKLRVEEVAGHPIDVGAEALLTVRPEGVGLVAALGLDEERIAPLTTAAQVRAGGTNHPLPARTMFGIPGSAEAARESGALSRAAVAAIEREPALDPLPPVHEDVSVGRLVRSRLGDEIADRLVEPLLGGVYAGRADDLSLRATMASLAARLAEGGSLVQAAAAVTGGGTRTGPIFTTVRGGLGRLPLALAGAGRFAVRTGVTVRSITRAPGGFALECGAVPASELVEAAAVIVAAPASKAARLLADVAPAAAGELGGIDAASMAIVTFAFPTLDGLPGSGLLVGTGERLATKAVTLSSQKWPLEADGLTFLRASVGRIGETQALQLEDAELVELVQRELRPLLGVTAPPFAARVPRLVGLLPPSAPETACSPPDRALSPTRSEHETVSQKGLKP